MEWILFTIGLFIGTIVGVGAIAIVSSGKHSELESEIISLRLQRKMLKEELLKQPVNKYKKPFKKRVYKPRKKTL